MTKSMTSRISRQKIAMQWSDPNSVKSTAYVKLLTTLCTEADTPFSLAVLIHLRAGDTLGMLSFVKTLSPNNYTENMTRVYMCDTQVSALVKKYKGHVDLDINPTIECAKKFISAELKCRKTNEFFYNGDFYRCEIRNDVMYRAKAIVADILGDVNNVNLTRVKFGSGRTFGIKQNVSEFFKLNGPLEVTLQAKELFLDLLEANPGWVSPFMVNPYSRTELTDMLVYVPGDLYSSVDKDATTDRPLGMPPLGNSVLCKAVGSHLKKRYKIATGIDISTAQYNHKRIVRTASISGKIATIDLSSASDTISYAVIHELLPREWFDLLDSLRSPAFLVRDPVKRGDSGKWYSYEKFTAMGCAFTFELESIIFYAICKACMDYSSIRGFLSVYGDDILIPTTVYNFVIAMLPHFGFDVNETKSFNTGFFRESCGSDFHNGIDVRPFFLKDVITPRVLVLWHNSWVRNGIRYIFPKTFATLRRFIPREIFDHLSGPLSHEGDSFIVDETVVDHTSHYSVVAILKTVTIDEQFRGILPFILYRMDQCNHQYLRGSANRLPIKVLDATVPLRYEHASHLYSNEKHYSEAAESYVHVNGRDLVNDSDVGYISNNAKDIPASFRLKRVIF